MRLCSVAYKLASEVAVTVKSIECRHTWEQVTPLQLIAKQIILARLCGQDFPRQSSFSSPLAHCHFGHSLTTQHSSVPHVSLMLCVLEATGVSTAERGSSSK